MSQDNIIQITDDDVFAWAFGRDGQILALISLINAVLTDSGFSPRIQPIAVRRQDEN